MKTHEKELQEYLSLEEADLLLEVGRFAEPTGQIYSPPSLIEKARKAITDLMPAVRKYICAHKDLAEAPELELALQILAVLIEGAEGTLACAAAAYFAKRGFKSICNDKSTGLP